MRKEKEEVRSPTPKIDMDRLKLLLEVYEETEGQPQVIRRAKLFDRLCSEKSIYIDNNPIVGTLTKYKYGGYPFPEIGCRWVKRVNRFSLQRGEATVTKDEKELIDRGVDFQRVGYKPSPSGGTVFSR